MPLAVVFMRILHYSAFGRKLYMIGNNPTATTYSGSPRSNRKTVKISKTVYPRKDYQKIYEEKYHNYRKVIEALKPAWSCFEN